MNCSNLWWASCDKMSAECGWMQSLYQLTPVCFQEQIPVLRELTVASSGIVNITQVVYFRPECPGQECNCWLSTFTACEECTQKTAGSFVVHSFTLTWYRVSFSPCHSSRQRNALMIFMTLMSQLIQHTVLKRINLANDVMLLNEQALKFNHVD